MKRSKTYIKGLIIRASIDLDIANYQVVDRYYFMKFSIVFDID